MHHHHRHDAPGALTLSCGVASFEDVQAKNWQALYELCDARLREAQNAGGDQMRAE